MNTITTAATTVVATTKTSSFVAEINQQHKLACAAANTAVRHAIRCGELLLEQKEQLKHGDFGEWINLNCTFAYSTAARYIRAARQNSTGVEISSLRGLFSSRGRSRTTQALRTPVTKISHERSPVPRQSVHSAAPAPTRCAQEAAQAAIPTPPATQTPPENKVDTTSLTIENAINLLKQTGMQGLIGQYRIAQGRVTKLRNQLARAEAECAKCEADVIAEAKRQA